MEVISIAVQRGGAGKTTTALALIHAALKEGKRVLAIDLDPQGNLSYSLGVKLGTPGNALDMMDGKPISRTIRYTKTEGLEVIPSSWALSTVQSSTGSARRVQTALKAVEGKYDLVIIDTPPTAGELQYNALYAADRVVIPLEAEIYSLASLEQIMATIKQFKEHQPSISVAGILLTQVENNKYARHMEQMIKDRAEALHVPFLGSVRKAVVVKEAAAFAESIFEYAPNSKPAQDYISIYTNIFSKEA